MSRSPRKNRRVMNEQSKEQPAIISREELYLVLEEPSAIAKQTDGEDQKLGRGHSKLRGWRTEQPLAEPRASGRVCGVRNPTCRLDASPNTKSTRLAEIATVT